MNTALCLNIGLCWFRLGFPTCCLHRHVGAPTGLKPKILLHAIMKIFWIFVEQGKIMAAEAPTVPVDATPTETNSAPTSQPPILRRMLFLPRYRPNLSSLGTGTDLCWLAYPDEQTRTEYTVLA